MTMRYELARIMVLDKMAAQGMWADIDDPEPHNEGPIRVMWENAYRVVDQMLPVILGLSTDEGLAEATELTVELRATILEYEHALEHAADTGPHHTTACPDCQRLCQSALDGVNRADFLEIARDE